MNFQVSVYNEWTAEPFTPITIRSSSVKRPMPPAPWRSNRTSRLTPLPLSIWISWPRSLMSAVGLEGPPSPIWPVEVTTISEVRPERVKLIPSVPVIFRIPKASETLAVAVISLSESGLLNQAMEVLFFNLSQSSSSGYAKEPPSTQVIDCAMAMLLRKSKIELGLIFSCLYISFF